jgi:type II secretion system protein J
LGSRGFTLIEILVAIALLAVLSVGISQVTTSTWSTNTKLSAESADTTEILLSLQSVEADLAQIYSPVIGPAFAGADGKVQEFWSAPLRSDGIRRSRFKGEAQKVSFVANNHKRVEADAPESDFQKVTWEVERNAKNTYTLYRTIDWDAFRYEDDRAKKPERVALIENLSSAKFTFYRAVDKQWVDTWDSESMYAKEDQRFPNLIKLKIEAPDPRNPDVQQPWELVVKPNQSLNYLDATARAAQKAKFE